MSSSLLILSLSLFLLSPGAKAMEEEDFKTEEGVIVAYGKKEEKDRFVNVKLRRHNIDNSEISSFALTLPKAPVIHPYDILENSRKNFGIPKFYYTACLDDKLNIFNQLPESQKIMEFLNEEKIHLKTVERFVVVQSDPWKGIQRLLRPHYWTSSKAPTYSNVAYWDNVKVRTAIFSPHESVKLIGLKEGAVKNGAFVEESAIVHNQFNQGKVVQSAEIQISPNNLGLLGIREDKTSLFWSIVAAGGKTAVTLHVILNDKDEEELQKKNITTLGSLKDELNKLYTEIINTKTIREPLYIDWDNSPNRERFSKNAIITPQNNGGTEVKIDLMESHLYQLQSKNLKDVNPGDMLEFSYDIEGDGDGMFLILRDKTHQRPLAGAIFELQNGSNIKRDLQFVVPQGAKAISVLFYNADAIKFPTLKIKSMSVNKVTENIEKTRKTLPIKWDNSEKREQFPKFAKIIEKDGKIQITADGTQSHLYQLESKILDDVNPGDKLKLSFDIEGDAKGITLILRDKTHQRPLAGAIFELQNGSNVKRDLQFVIPKGAKEISVLLYNPEKMESKTFIINELKMEKM